MYTRKTRFPPEFGWFVIGGRNPTQGQQLGSAKRQKKIHADIPEKFIEALIHSGPFSISISPLAPGDHSVATDDSNPQRASTRAQEAA